ncbi:MAG: hypothetical protein ACTH1K_00625 [Latilactobacillus curvatus]
MSTEHRVAAILTDSSIAIAAEKEFLDAKKIVRGDRVKIVSHRVNIKDPSNPEKELGSYTIYKDTLEITEIREHFIVATKYTRTGSTMALQISGKKELGRIKYSSKNNVRQNNLIAIGDEVDFFG